MTEVKINFQYYYIVYWMEWHVQHNWYWIVVKYYFYIVNLLRHKHNSIVICACVVDPINLNGWVSRWWQTVSIRRTDAVGLFFIRFTADTIVRCIEKKSFISDNWIPINGCRKFFIHPLLESSDTMTSAPVGCSLDKQTYAIKIIK